MDIQALNQLKGEPFGMTRKENHGILEANLTLVPITEVYMQLISLVDLQTTEISGIIIMREAGSQ